MQPVMAPEEKSIADGSTYMERKPNWSQLAVMSVTLLEPLSDDSAT
jgi:hypothetical protein